MSTEIKCELCGARVHAIQVHLKHDHPTVSLEEYTRRFPKAPLLSDLAKARIAERDKERGVAMAAKAEAGVPAGKAKMHELFGLGPIPECMNGKGEPILVNVLEPTDGSDLVPDVDGKHIWEAENLKDILMALELNIPLYVWGHAGVGKTTDIEQVCARTHRPTMRAQHTINTEEAHILGQWVAVKGETIFQPGPLPVCMRHGWNYLADEYDFGLPSVLSVYQPVLEGKPLIIKDAPAEWRVVRPHQNFRFTATGNTNGSGDETGLYQGTAVQNAANYDRFGMCIRKQYMPKNLEAKIVAGQAGIGLPDAEKLVAFATQVREAYEGGQLSNTISPRALINSASIGLRRGSWRMGIARAFTNKLNKVDREVVDAVAQRVFGGTA
jgi:cobaltochelatase CobS